LIDCLEHVGFRNLLQGGAGRLPCPAYRHRAICLTYPTSALLVRDRKVRSGACVTNAPSARRLSVRCRLAEETFAEICGNGRDAPCARSCRAANEGLVLSPRQREDAAQRQTLPATISQRRWPRPLRPKQWRVLGFQNQAVRAVRGVPSRNGTRPLTPRRIERMLVQRLFRRA